MPGQKKKKPVPSKKKSPTSRVPNRTKPAPTSQSGGDEFTTALAELLRSRKIGVPKGLLTAPPAAYAGQSVSFVERIAAVSDDELKAYAAKIAGYVARQQARSKAAWDSSPLIVELRRRKLKEPAMPSRVVGASVSLRRPLKEWSDAELLKAVGEWVKRGS